jgi:hypothetical protein
MRPGLRAWFGGVGTISAGWRIGSGTPLRFPLGTQRAHERLIDVVAIDVVAIDVVAIDVVAIDVVAIDVVAIDVDMLALTALLDEAAGGVAADRSLIGGQDAEPDAAEVLHAEGPVEEEADGLPAVALADEVGVVDADAERGRPRRPIVQAGMQADLADVRAVDLDREVASDASRGMLLGDLLLEAPLAGAASETGSQEKKAGRTSSRLAMSACWRATSSCSNGRKVTRGPLSITYLLGAALQG